MVPARRHLGWIALPMLLAGPGCAPVRDYQEAVRSLRFSLDRVEPRLQFALPLERSRVAFRLTLGVANPSRMPFQLKEFIGTLRLEGATGTETLGEVRLLQALALAPGGMADLVVEVSFTYQDLQRQWGPLQAALRQEGAGAWILDGSLKAEVYGLPLQLPVRTRRAFGAGA